MFLRRVDKILLHVLEFPIYVGTVYRIVIAKTNTQKRTHNTRDN